MFELVVTYRGNFAEEIIDRYATAKEARAVAKKLATQYAARILRVWVRSIREAPMESEGQAPPSN